MPKLEYLYHVCSREQWNAALPNQYRQEGPFTHLSSAQELDQSIRVHLSQQTHLLLLCIKSNEIMHDLRWETVSTRSTPMPHLYGVLPRSSIQWAVCLPDEPDLEGSRCPSIVDLSLDSPPNRPRFPYFDF